MSTLHDLLVDKADEVVAAVTARQEGSWPATATPPRQWVKVMLGELAGALTTDAGGMTIGESATAAQQGAARRDAGDTPHEVVRDFAMICDGVCQVAVDHHVEIAPDEFKTMNWWLDGGVAAAIEQFDCTGARGRVRNDARALDVATVLAIRNAVAIARVSYDALRTGRVGITSRTSDMLERSLGRIETLVKEGIERLLPDSSS